MFLVFRSHRLRRRIRRLLHLPDQRNSLIENRRSLADIPSNFCRIGQHPCKLAVEVFLGFFVVFISFADTANQADFFVLLIVRGINARVRGSLYIILNSCANDPSGGNTDLFIVGSGFSLLLLLLLLLMLSSAVTGILRIVLLFFLLDVFYDAIVRISKNAKWSTSTYLRTAVRLASHRLPRLLLGRS